MITGDLSTTVVETTQRLVKEAVEHWGRLDLLVNNAAIYVKNPIDNATEQQWDSHMDINTKAPYFLVQVVYYIITL